MAPHNPGFQTVIFSGSPGYALYPSAQVPLSLKSILPRQAKAKGATKAALANGEKALTTAEAELALELIRARCELLQCTRWASTFVLLRVSRSDPG